MNMTLKKKLTAIAAIGSSVFLLAACEPQDDGVGTTGDTDTMGTTQDDAQTYGQRDRDFGADPAVQDPATTQDPAMQDPYQQDPAVQQDPAAGTTADDDVGTAF
jgi:hypothetical protein